MKQVKVIVMTAFFTAVAVGMSAQNTFFPTKAGVVQMYEQKDAKGKTSGYTRMTIKEISGSGNNMSISYEVEGLDKNRKPQFDPMPLTVTIKDGVVFLDMKQLFASMQQEMQGSVEFSGIPMELPSNMQPGTTLKDAESTMTIDLGIMKVTTVIKMTDGKCLAIEDVTTPAGTFKCYKITQTVTTTVMNSSRPSRTVSWYAPGIGTVKTETYDNKDKLTGSTELVEVKN